METNDKEFCRVHSVIEHKESFLPYYESKYIGNNIWIEYTIVESEVK